MCTMAGEMIIVYDFLGLCWRLDYCSSILEEDELRERICMVLIVYTVLLKWLFQMT